MGRHPYSDRHTVEEYSSITTKSLYQFKCFTGGGKSGCISWDNKGKYISHIYFTVSTILGNERIHFHGMGIASTNNQARLDSTPCFFGGRRFWFICPDCTRRVGVLYFANEKHFACRLCHKLTYISTKENHKFDSLFWQMGIDPKEGRSFFNRRKN